MSNLSEALTYKRKQLRPTTTRVTQPSGQVFEESPDGQKLLCCTSQGFVTDTKPDLQIGHVAMNLLVASQDVANCQTTIASNNITAILNVSANPIANHWPGITYSHIPILDLPEEQLQNYFPVCFKFIEQNSSVDGGRVLVHCNAGVSRSVSIVTAYLMSTKKLTVQQALDVVRSCRPSAKPNQGFMKQLEVFEEFIRSTR